MAGVFWQPKLSRCDDKIGRSLFLEGRAYNLVFPLHVADWTELCALKCPFLGCRLASKTDDERGLTAAPAQCSRVRGGERKRMRERERERDGQSAWCNMSLTPVVWGRCQHTNMEPKVAALRWHLSMKTSLSGSTLVWRQSVGLDRAQKKSVTTGTWQRNRLYVMTCEACVLRDNKQWIPEHGKTSGLWAAW